MYTGMRPNCMTSPMRKEVLPQPGGARLNSVDELVWLVAHRLLSDTVVYTYICRYPLSHVILPLGAFADHQRLVILFSRICYLYTHTCKNIDMFSSAHTRKYTYIHIHTHIYKHIYTHIHTHLHQQSLPRAVFNRPEEPQ